jgi:hypothetical protein
MNDSVHALLSKDGHEMCGDGGPACGQGSARWRPRILSQTLEAMLAVYDQVS